MERIKVMNQDRGRVTLPAQAGQEELVKYLIKDWGVDAIRDSDGTALSADILEMNLPIYSTICLVRAEQSFPREHPEHLPQIFLTTPRLAFTGEPLSFD
ncbi:MAG: D-galactosyl-beta-1-4-L-rhamnose phosphorylase, partial [Lentisphaerae bacterium]|nr:D-galactosyl-beta-1-4-L-rhamnose phosphorylase [Lentisphaerota bacterium]